MDNRGEKWRLHVAKRASEQFIRRHYPGEAPAFDLLWGRILEDLGSYQAGAGQGGSKSGPILPFAARYKLTTTVHLVALTLLATLDELGAHGDIEVPSIERLGDATIACASALKVPANVRRRLAESLPTILHVVITDAQSMHEQEKPNAVQQVHVQPRGKIVIDGVSANVPSKQSAILLQELVRRPRILWLSGFVLFEWWARRPPDDPYRAFSKVISQTRSWLGRCGCRLGIVTEKLGTENVGYWALEVPVSVRLEGDVIHAQQLCEQGEKHLENGDRETSGRLAVEALACDETSSRAIALACSVIEKTVDRNPKAARQSVLLATRLYQRFENAIHVVEQLGFIDRESRWELARAKFLEEQRSFGRQLREALYMARAFLETSRTLTEEELDYLRLNDTIEAAKIDESHKAQEAVLKNKHVSDVIAYTAGRCRRLIPGALREYSDSQIKMMAAGFLFEKIIHAGKAVAEFDELSHVKNAWIQHLTREMLFSCGLNHSTLTPEMQSEIMRVWEQEDHLKTQGNVADITSLAKTLNWRPSKVREVLEAAKKLTSEARIEEESLEL